MGMLDDVLGGLGHDAGAGIGQLLKGQGGVGGLVEQFTKHGLGDAVGSWVGTGANMNITADQIRTVLGSGPIAEFAARLGVSPDQASETLAGLLPEAVDRLTPGGDANAGHDLLNRIPGGLGGVIGDFLKR